LDKRDIYVVIKNGFKDVLFSFQVRPEGFYTAPKDLHVFINNRPFQKTFLVGQRSTRRESAVLVPVRFHVFFIAGQHEKGRDENVEAQI
jgi:hypothetical protein